MRYPTRPAAVTRSFVAIAFSTSLLLAALHGPRPARGEEPGPIITQVSNLSTADAPLIETTDHGSSGSNVLIRWTLIGPGPKDKGDALYGFCAPLNPERGDPTATPLVFWLDLETGKFREVFYLGKTPGSAAKAPDAPALDAPSLDALDDGMGGPAPTARLVSNWEWAAPTCSALGPARTVLIGAADGQVLRFHPRQDKFEALFRAGGRCSGLAMGNDAIWAVGDPGLTLYRQEALGLEKYPLLVAAQDEVITGGGLVVDQGDQLYTAARRGGSWQLLTVSLQQAKAVSRRLLGELTVSAIDLQTTNGKPWCRVTTSAGVSKIFLLEKGQATPTDAPPAPPQRGYQLHEDFDHQPHSVSVERPGAEPRRIEFRFGKASADEIKSMCLSPDGKYILGTANPSTSWWRFPLEGDGRFEHRGHDYSTYQLLPVGDRVYAVGYPINKLMRWNPDAPWTLNWPALDADPRSSWHNTAYAAYDCNAEALLRWRTLRGNNLRRPAGLALGADGRIYSAGRDMGINLNWREEGTIYSVDTAGALYWYDPANHSAGCENRDPDWDYYGALDLAAADHGRYIAVTTWPESIPAAPPRPDLPRGMLFVWDTQTRQFVAKVNPIGQKLRFVEEGPDGLLVVGGDGGWPGAPRFSSQIFVLDTKTMKPTRIIRMPWHLYHSTYVSVMRFERGPDERIYFYGTDEKGTALFRVDARSGLVEAVAQGKGITDQIVYDGRGATFAFTPKRVFFGGATLVSVPIEKIVGPPPTGGFTLRRNSAADPTDPAMLRPPSPQAVAKARAAEEALQSAWLAKRNAGVPEAVPALVTNQWVPQPWVQWDVSDGPMWASLGHGSTVLCLRAAGDGQVHLSVRRVTSFAADGAPAATEILQEMPVTLAAKPGRLEYLRVSGATIKLCLIVRPLTAGLDIEVLERILDPEIPTSVRFMEANAPADRSWHQREKTPAPWAATPPVAGKLSGAAGQEVFAPGAAHAAKDRKTFHGPENDPSLRPKVQSEDLEEKAQPGP